MKKYITILVSICLLSSCNNNKEEKLIKAVTQKIELGDEVTVKTIHYIDPMFKSGDIIKIGVWEYLIIETENSGRTLKEYEYAISIHEDEENKNTISIRDYTGHIEDLKLEPSESFNKFINEDNK
jgi:hypothetical protein